MQVQSNLSTKATQGTEESGSCWQVAVMGGGGGGRGGNMTNFLRGVKHVYCAKFILTVSPNGNPIINSITETKYTQKTWTKF